RCACAWPRQPTWTRRAPSGRSSRARERARVRRARRASHARAATAEPPPVRDHCDVLIIGGGAAGLMCAITAGRRGLRVRVLEHANRVGKKILMSGGGRCNFTNTGAGPANYISANPHFCKSALARYTPGDFIELV